MRIWLAVPGTSLCVTSEQAEEMKKLAEAYALAMATLHRKPTTPHQTSDLPLLNDPKDHIKPILERMWHCLPAADALDTFAPWTFTMVGATPPVVHALVGQAIWDRYYPAAIMETLDEGIVAENSVMPIGLRRTAAFALARLAEVEIQAKDSAETDALGQNLALCQEKLHLSQVEARKAGWKWSPY